VFKSGVGVVNSWFPSFDGVSLPANQGVSTLGGRDLHLLYVSKPRRVAMFKNVKERYYTGHFWEVAVIYNSQFSKVWK
jgi:hypothetical protein